MAEQLIRVRRIHSGIGCRQRHRSTLVGLGLVKTNQERVLKASPQVWGMISKVPHLVKVVEVLSDSKAESDTRTKGVKAIAKRARSAAARGATAKKGPPAKGD